MTPWKKIALRMSATPPAGANPVEAAFSLYQAQAQMFAQMWAEGGGDPQQIADAFRVPLVPSGEIRPPMIEPDSPHKGLPHLSPDDNGRPARYIAADYFAELGQANDRSRNGRDGRQAWPAWLPLPPPGCFLASIDELYPFSRVRDANVLIFPNLAAANVAYKLLQRLGNAEAIGPVLMGMDQPVHVLQRGDEVRDIVNIAALAVVDAQERGN